MEPGNPSGSFAHRYRVIQLSDPQTAIQILQKEPILARFRICVTTVEFWPELVCPRQDVPVSCDLMPHATSMPVTRVVDPSRILAEESAWLPTANPASHDLAWKCRRVRCGFTAQNGEGVSAQIFTLEG